MAHSLINGSLCSLDADTNLKAIDFAKKFSLVDATYLAEQAWSLVKSATITNCFRKAGLKRSEEEEARKDMDDLYDVELPPGMTAEEFESHVELDNELETVGELSNAELLRTAAGQQEEEDGEEQEILSMKEKLQIVGSLQRFVQETGMTKVAFADIERKVLSQAIRTNKQKTMDSYVRLKE